MKQATAPPAMVYPELPVDGDSQSFRLQEVTRLKKQLEDERDKREVLSKKYRRGVNAIDGVDTALLVASMGMGIGGLGLLSTIIAAPVVLGLEVAALGCGALGVSAKFIRRRLGVKAGKHNEIRVLAESKLNTIADHVSTALVDGKISQEEFRLILDEIDKYTQMKAEIRSRARKTHAGISLDEEAKNSLIQQGRDEARASFIKKLSD